MKFIALFIFGVLIASTSVLAQTPSDPIEIALAAAPSYMREATTVIKWKSDFTYDTLKKGTNRLVCYDRSNLPEHEAYSIECTSIANLDRVAQNLKFEAVGDKGKTQAMIDAAEKDGTRVKPEFGSMWYHLAGRDREHAIQHTTVSMPGATAQSLGLPDNPKQGGVWVMSGGTSAAHLMIPGE
jgi:hypothetical protein